MHNVVAVVITYNPDVVQLQKNIEQMLVQTNKVIIVDNGSKNLSEWHTLFSNQNIIVVSLQKNVGIAKAQNIGFITAEEYDVNWVLTMDQDSLLAPKTIDKLLEVPEAKKETTAILTPRYVDVNWTDEQRQHEDNNLNGLVQDMDTVIASGNLVSVNAWQAIGGYDEWLFIDQVDLDFDKRLKLAGFNIFQVNTVEMAHEIGEVIDRPIFQKLLGFSKTSIFSDHSAMRQYYIFRNRIIYWRRYPEVRRNEHFVRGSITGSRHILLFKKHKLKKLFASWKGIKDAWYYDPEKDSNFQELKERAITYGRNRETNK